MPSQDVTDRTQEYVRSRTEDASRQLQQHRQEQVLRQEQNRREGAEEDSVMLRQRIPRM